MARDVVKPKSWTERVRLPRWAVLLAVGLGTLVLVAGCAAGANTVAQSGAPAGFWLGLWHGIILPIAFLVSLFNSHVGIYEIHNNGGWYNFGFVLGIGIAISVTHGPRTTSARTRARSRD